MKYLIIIFACIMNFTFCSSQSVKTSAIVMQEFYSKDNLLLVDSLNNLVIVDKVFSEIKLPLGDINSTNIEMDDLDSFPKKYVYYIKVHYNKTNNVFVQDFIELDNTKIIKGYEPIVFQEFPAQNFNYQCDEILYDNLIFYKRIGFNEKIFIEKFNEQNYSIKLIDSDCQNFSTQNFENKILYHDTSDIVILSCKKKIVIYCLSD